MDDFVVRGSKIIRFYQLVMVVSFNSRMDHVRDSAGRLSDFRNSLFS